MISSDSKFDKWRRGEVELTDSEYNGYQMFLREGGDPEVVPGGQFGADCFHCHGEAGLQFTDNLFHNNGLDASFEADRSGLNHGKPHGFRALQNPYT